CLNISTQCPLKPPSRWKQSWLKIYELPDTQLQAGIERSPFSPPLVRQTGSGGKTPIKRQLRRASFLNLIARIVLTNAKACLHTGHRKSGFWIGRRTCGPPGSLPSRTRDVKDQLKQGR